MTKGVCSQLVVSSGSPSGKGRQATAGDTLVMYNQCSREGRMPPLITQNPVNSQYKLDDEACEVTLYSYPVKAYVAATKSAAAGLV